MQTEVIVGWTPLPASPNTRSRDGTFRKSPVRFRLNLCNKYLIDEG
jgi:hypothetical protein